MDTLFSRYRSAMLLVAVLFLQLVLLAFQVKRDADVPLIRVWAVGIITPVERFSSGFIRGFVGLWSNYLDLRGARQENLRLSEEVGRLKLMHHQLQEEASEARRLKEVLEFRQKSPSTTLVARVIGSSADEHSRVVFIDKGIEAGITRNMPVITPDGIVGKVHRVFRGTSQVLVITDPSSGVGVLLQKSRVHGVLRGQSGFFCQLRWIVNDEKVEAGELVYTSGEDLVYPKGLPVGTVSVVKNGNLFKEITVQPAAQLNRLEEVLVVVKAANQEIPTPEEQQQVAAAETDSQPLPVPAREPRAPEPESAAARARSETEADRMMQSYRDAITQSGKTPEQRAIEGLLTPPQPTVRRPSAAGSTAPSRPPGTAPAPAAASNPGAGSPRPAGTTSPASSAAAPDPTTARPPGTTTPPATTSGNAARKPENKPEVAQPAQPRPQTMPSETKPDTAKPETARPAAEKPEKPAPTAPPEPKPEPRQ